MSDEKIVVRGAREHTLKNVSLEIPRDALVVVTGLSGSGKSSLAFDTIYAEGQRRYMESLSAYARQFLGLMERPDVDFIDGLSPVIAIEQKTVSRNPRSTVGTVTEVYDFLRLLFARAATAYSYVSGAEMRKQSDDEIIDAIAALPEGARAVVLAPVVKGRKGHYRELFESVARQGFERVRVDGELREITDGMKLDRYKTHDIEVVVDRLVVREGLRPRIAASVETALSLGEGTLVVRVEAPPRPADASPVATAEDSRQRSPRSEAAGKGEAHDVLFSRHLVDPETGLSYEEPSPNTFSFNSPYGACPTCDGLGRMLEIDPSLVVPYPEKTIAEGGVVALGVPRDVWAFAQVRAVAERYGFTFEQPLGTLTDAQRTVLLEGAGEEMFDIEYVYKGRKVTYQHRFQGVYGHIRHLLETSTTASQRRWAEAFMRLLPCKTCHGGRLRPEALAYRFAGYGIADLVQMDLATLRGVLGSLALEGRTARIAGPIVKEIVERLDFMVGVGVDYLTLDRPARTLSGGESQRIRLATQIGTQLTGVLYVLDEPSIGLHPRDNERLIRSLERLRDLGNSVLVVEHDREMIEAADFVVDLGPGAGEHGGEVVAIGTPEELYRGEGPGDREEVPGSKGQGGEGQRGEKQGGADGTGQGGAAQGDGAGTVETDGVEAADASASPSSGLAPSPLDPGPSSLPRSLTTAYLTGQRHIPIPPVRRAGTGEALVLTGALGHNLKGDPLRIPLGTLTAVTGVSGSGKSSLVNQTLFPALNARFHHGQAVPLPYRDLAGAEHLDKVIAIDQAPIGRTPRSNPATYTGLYGHIRDLFAQLPESKIRGYKPGRFSFNVKGGRCETCKGAGIVKLEMNFLPDVYVACETCKGRRYNAETLEVRFKGASIADVLDMTVDEALAFFEAVPRIERKLRTLASVGLGYVRLGQQATTLSGGEAQRIKLAKELSRPGTGKTLYLLDEPTTGLHFEDIRHLLVVLRALVAKGNTVLVIEHNLDVVKVADHVVDLGPGGGMHGGHILFSGTPEGLAAQDTPTARFLRVELERGVYEEDDETVNLDALASAEPDEADEEVDDEVEAAA